MIARPALAALFLLVAAPAAARPLAPSPEVAALRTEIAALQVDHVLALSPDQARALLPVLQQAAAQVQAFRARVEAANPALVAALTRARDELRAGGPVSPETAQAIRDARRSGMAPDRDAGKALRAQAVAILTPAQVQSLRSVPLGAGPGFPDGKARMDGAGPGKGGGRRLLMLGVLTSDPFLALVAARAR
jgi:hypothetical protein